MLDVQEQLRRVMRGSDSTYSQEELVKKLTRSAERKQPLRVKLGMDPTAPDLTLGHTVVLQKLRDFQDCGHKAVLIIGDYTARIGDPTGKTKARPTLDEATIKQNAETYFQQMSLGHLIVMTHVHMFGFTTSFFIIGIPFSLHFYRSRAYQWIFPMGLAASLCDIGAWWGMKFISVNFEYVTWFCGVVFSTCYVWMLGGLIRVLFFPNVHWWFPRFFGEDQPLDD